MEQVSSTNSIRNEQFNVKENQEARAFLRERLLRLLTGVVGKKCELYTIEATKVTGEYVGCDINLQQFLIDNLKAPVFTLPHAIVRNEDIVQIHLPGVCDVMKP